MKEHLDAIEAALKCAIGTHGDRCELGELCGAMKKFTGALGSVAELRRMLEPASAESAEEHLTDCIRSIHAKYGGDLAAFFDDARVALRAAKLDFSRRMGR